MAQMRTAIVTVAALDAQCPVCKEMLAEPTNGSQFFTEYEYKPGMVLFCACCGTNVRLPRVKRAALKGGY